MGMIQKQALKHAEDVAERACLIRADDKSLYRLGVSRSRLVQSNDTLNHLRPDECIQRMQDAGRCLRRSLKLKPSEDVERLLVEIKAWLAKNGVHTLFPEYV